MTTDQRKLIALAKIMLESRIPNATEDAAEILRVVLKLEDQHAENS